MTTRKRMRWQLWHSGLVGPVLAFWEGPMLMIKEGASPFGSVLGSPLLAFHSQLSSLGWPTSFTLHRMLPTSSGKLGSDQSDQSTSLCILPALSIANDVTLFEAWSTLDPCYGAHIYYHLHYTIRACLVHRKKKLHPKWKEK